jgi:hypothetical protein
MVMSMWFDRGVTSLGGRSCGEMLGIADLELALTIRCPSHSPL